MKDKIQQLKIKVLKEISEIKNESGTEEIWRKYLGRQDGELTKILKGLKDLSEKEKPEIGSLANQIKKEIEDSLMKKRNSFCYSSSFKRDFFDFSLPGKNINYGHLHPLTQIKNELGEIFSSMGFKVLQGLELEKDYYNFEALNIPQGHPARDMWDTFYLKDSKKTELLRTHTSAMQVRVMEKEKPPLRVCVMGRCFRNEATDASHEHTLYQIEGFVVDENITVANLIDTLKSFLKALFGKEVKIRLRPSYFPFTEPSFEVDFACLNCQGKGCQVCQKTGWVEILGSGMIHPKVFEFAGYPKGKYTGFAFGVGIDRLAMMRYKIDDIRWFHSGDLRFIRQF